MMYNSDLPFFALENQWVFLRVDLNVPLNRGTILDDTKIKAVLPTLNYLLEKKAKVVLATHLGRPTPEIFAELSTFPFIEWFKTKGYTVDFATTPAHALEIQNNPHTSFVILENLRFFSGEQSYDIEFAKKLSNLASYYINDAFGVLHRKDTSLTLLPFLYPINRRSLGFLIQKELLGLDPLIKGEQSPFLMTMGGGKVASKLPVIEKLLNRVDFIAVCPALVFTFLKASHISVGKSLIDENVLEIAKNILNKAKDSRAKLLFPEDFYVAQDSFKNRVLDTPVRVIEHNQVGIAIGPATIKKWSNIVSKSKLIYYNALMGDISRPETLQATKSLLQTVAQATGYTVIGGGESVTAANLFKLNSQFSFCSTGGGVVLDLIAGINLPGLQPFILS